MQICMMSAAKKAPRLCFVWRRPLASVRCRYKYGSLGDRYRFPTCSLTTTITHHKCVARKLPAKKANALRKYTLFFVLQFYIKQKYIYIYQRILTYYFYHIYL